MVDLDGAIEPLVTGRGTPATHDAGDLPASRTSILAWLRGDHRRDHRPAARLERVLAVGRALIVTTLAALYLYPAQPERLPLLTYGVLAAYALYSLAVLAYTHRSTRLAVAHGGVLHGLDIFWVAALTLVSEQPVSAFLLLYLFVVLAAAYRWGFNGTMATSAAAIAIFLADTALAERVALAATAVSESPNPTLVTIASLLLAGFLLGYLAEQDKRSRNELATLADLTMQPRVRRGLSGSVIAVSRGLSRALDADGVCFVLQDYDTRETSLWQFDGGSLAMTTSAAPVPLDASQQDAWFFEGPGRVWYGSRTAAEPEMRARAVQPHLWPLRRERVTLPPALAAAGRFRHVAVANFGLADEWRGRVYLFDPRGHGSVEQSLHFLDGLVEHVTPALTNVFLLGRLRARVTAAERARVARELHDGAIQALIGIEMKVEAMRRRGDALAADLSGELGEVQSLLRRQVLELRELMQALRPIALDASEQLPDILASVVERFRRDTGVQARFISAGGSASLNPATALEIVRIVQEGLVNVRKHSRARNVLVRLTAGQRGCIVVIEDDGVGFEFEGTFSGEELDRRRIGPAIIKERARIAGAHLTIESRAGTGTRIEIIVNAAHV